MGKHVVAIDSIYPVAEEINNLRSLGACCGISLSNPNYYGGRLAALLHFLDEKFDRVMLITTGHLYRHNYKIKGYNEELATQKAIEEENLYISKELSRHRDLLSKKKFTISKSLDLFFLNEVQDSLRAVKFFYEKNETFKKEVENSAKNFLSQTNTNMLNKQLDFSLDFLLEEFSFMNYLTLAGHRVEVYPGNIPSILHEIANGKFSDAPDGLKTKIGAQLKIKR